MSNEMDSYGLSMSNGMGDLKRFIIDNNIVGTSAGVCIALAAKDGIQSLVGDIIIPAIVIILKALHIDFLTKFLPVTGKSQFNVTDFVKQIITFVLIIVISFIFVKFAFGYLLGVKYNANNNDDKQQQPQQLQRSHQPQQRSQQQWWFMHWLLHL